LTQVKRPVSRRSKRGGEGAQLDPEEDEGPGGGITSRSITNTPRRRGKYSPANTTFFTLRPVRPVLLRYILATAFLAEIVWFILNSLDATVPSSQSQTSHMVHCMDEPSPVVATS
jgi:hypothetical protein